MLPCTVMTKQELLKIIVGQARTNGFEFRRWCTTRLGMEWTNAEAAFEVLESQRRYYALLFSHEFASTFWKPGSEITFQVERQSFQRTAPDGTVKTITRKPYTRRSARKDAWRYHLSTMALADDPLRYIRRYLRVDEELDPDGALSTPRKPPRSAEPDKAASSARQAGKRTARPLPKDLPAFLRRPYP
jgi:hypothetical protein